MTQRKQLPEFSFTNLLKGFIFSNVGEAKGTLLKRFVSSKMAFECTISTSESICFGELRKCPSALWAYIESGIGFWLSGKDLRKRWFVYCQAGLKTIGLEYMPEKDGVAWRMEWDGRRLKPCGIEKERRSITWWRSRIFHFLSWQPESDVMTVFFARRDNTFWDSKTNSILQHSITASETSLIKAFLSGGTITYLFILTASCLQKMILSLYSGNWALFQVKDINWKYDNSTQYIFLYFH